MGGGSQDGPLQPRGHPEPLNTNTGGISFHRKWMRRLFVPGSLPTGTQIPWPRAGRGGRAATPAPLVLERLGAQRAEAATRMMQMLCGFSSAGLRVHDCFHSVDGGLLAAGPGNVIPERRSRFSRLIHFQSSHANALAWRRWRTAPRPLPQPRVVMASLAFSLQADCASWDLCPYLGQTRFLTEASKEMQLP